MRDFHIPGRSPVIAGRGMAATSMPAASLAAVEVLKAGGNALDAIMNAPLVRCDEVQWSLFGISLAGWNFLVSTASALWIFALLRKKG